MKIKVTKKGFEKFLADHPKQRFARMKACYCPLAAYCKFLGAEKVSVGSCRMLVDGKEITHRKWMVVFVYQVDARKGFISGKQALEILRSL